MVRVGRSRGLRRRWSRCRSRRSGPARPSTRARRGRAACGSSYAATGRSIRWYPWRRTTSRRAGRAARPTGACGSRNRATPSAPRPCTPMRRRRAHEGEGLPPRSPVHGAVVAAVLRVLVRLVALFGAGTLDEVVAGPRGRRSACGHRESRRRCRRRPPPTNRTWMPPAPVPCDARRSSPPARRCAPLRYRLVESAGGSTAHRRPRSRAPRRCRPLGPVDLDDLGHVGQVYLHLAREQLVEAVRGRRQPAGVALQRLVRYSPSSCQVLRREPVHRARDHLVGDRPAAAMAATSRKSARSRRDSNRRSSSREFQARPRMRG